MNRTIVFSVSLATVFAASAVKAVVLVEPPCDNATIKSAGQCTGTALIEECKPLNSPDGLTCPNGIRWVVEFEQKSVCKQPDPPGPASNRACVAPSQFCAKQVECGGPLDHEYINGQWVAFCPGEKYPGQTKMMGTRAYYTSDCDSGGRSPAP